MTSAISHWRANHAACVTAIDPTGRRRLIPSGWLGLEDARLLALSSTSADRGAHTVNTGPILWPGARLRASAMTSRLRGMRADRGRPVAGSPRRQTFLTPTRRISFSH